MARRRPPTVHGFAVIDKPAGMTSHDVVNVLRKKLGERRIGHAGTLDPDATGVMLVGVGNGTRLLKFLSEQDKTYSCDIVFGVETDSLDSTGVITATYDMAPIDVAKVREIIASLFIGEILQVPPMVSALKVDGKRLHELAREGIEIERTPRPVHVMSFEVASTDDPMVITAHIHCGSGTYVRSLGADLGTALGGGAHIRALRRHSVGMFTLDDASSLDEPNVLTMDEMLRGMQRETLTDAEIDDVLYGRPREKWSGNGPWAIFRTDGELIAVYEQWRDNLAKPSVVFGAR
jgi:tRNA pseudouridine55 synthase